MEALLLERMRKGLLQKQDNLTEWIHATPLGKKKSCWVPQPNNQFRPAWM
jgi:hypothetical protein